MSVDQINVNSAHDLNTQSQIVYDKKKDLLRRGNYGQLLETYSAGSMEESIFINQLLDSGLKLTDEAAAKGKIKKKQDNMVWKSYREKRGYAVVHDLYDVSLDGKKAMVCVRIICADKYGFSTISKAYYQVGRCGKSGLRVKLLDKNFAAKACRLEICKVPGKAMALLNLENPGSAVSKLMIKEKQMQQKERDRLKAAAVKAAKAAQASAINTPLQSNQSKGAEYHV